MQQCIRRVFPDRCPLRDGSQGRDLRSSRPPPPPPRRVMVSLRAIKRRCAGCRGVPTAGMRLARETSLASASESQGSGWPGFADVLPIAVARQGAVAVPPFGQHFNSAAPGDLASQRGSWFARRPAGRKGGAT
jgi:hypothetical protein